MTRASCLRSPRGQATLELAVFLPFLLLILLGAIELGNAWHVANKVAQAAHEGVEHVRRTKVLSSPDVDAIVTSVAGPRATSLISSRPSTSVQNAKLVTV